MTSVDEARMPAFLSFCFWVATACCCANKGTDISILAVGATRLRKTPRVKAMALQLWNQLQEGEKKVATTEEGQKTKPSKAASLAAALQTASTKQKKKPTKGQRAAPVTPQKQQKQRKPRKMASGAGPSDPSSGGSSGNSKSNNSGNIKENTRGHIISR